MMDRGGTEPVLELPESSLRLWGPAEGDKGGGEDCEWGCNAPVVPDKYPVQFSKTQEALQLFVVGRCKPLCLVWQQLLSGQEGYADGGALA